MIGRLLMKPSRLCTSWGAACWILTEHHGTRRRTDSGRGVHYRPRAIMSRARGQRTTKDEMGGGWIVGSWTIVFDRIGNSTLPPPPLLALSPPTRGGIFKPCPAC